MSTVVRHPTAFTDPTLPTMDLYLLYQEADAWAHFILFGDSSTITNRSLLNGAASPTATPSFNANAAILRDAESIGCECYTDIPAYTMACVFKYPSSPQESNVFCGNFSGGAGHDGISIGARATPRELQFATYAGTASWLNIAVDSSEWIFAAVAVDGTGSEVYSPQFISSQFVDHEFDSGDQSAENDSVLIGPRRRNGGGTPFGGDNANVAEFLFWKERKTQTELQTIYSRSQSRMLEFNGITLS